VHWPRGVVKPVGGVDPKKCDSGIQCADSAARGKEFNFNAPLLYETACSWTPSGWSVRSAMAWLRQSSTLKPHRSAVLTARPRHADTAADLVGVRRRPGQYQRRVVGQFQRYELGTAHRVHAAGGNRVLAAMRVSVTHRAQVPTHRARARIDSTRVSVSAFDASRTASTALSVSPLAGAGTGNFMSSEGATRRAFARAAISDRRSRAHSPRSRLGQMGFRHPGQSGDHPQ
jgi:hypothetical protein